VRYVAPRQIKNGRLDLETNAFGTAPARISVAMPNVVCCPLQSFD